MIECTTSSPHLLQVGQKIVYSRIEPGPPLWTYGWPWQDGDKRLVKWLYELFGWSLPLMTVGHTVAVTGIPTITTLEVK